MCIIYPFKCPQYITLNIIIVQISLYFNYSTQSINRVQIQWEKESAAIRWIFLLFSDGSHSLIRNIPFDTVIRKTDAVAHTSYFTMRE